WAAAVKAGTWRPDGRERQLEFALKAVEPKYASPILTQVMSNRSIDRSGSGPWIELIGSAGDQKLLQRLYAQVLEEGFDESALLQAAFEGLRETGGSQLTKGVLPLCEKEHPREVRQQAVLVLAALDREKAAKPAVALLLEEKDRTDQSDQSDLSDFWRALLKN